MINYNLLIIFGSHAMFLWLFSLSQLDPWHIWHRYGVWKTYTPFWAIMEVIHNIAKPDTWICVPVQIEHLNLSNTDIMCCFIFFLGLVFRLLLPVATVSLRFLHRIWRFFSFVFVHWKVIIYFKSYKMIRVQSAMFSGSGVELAMTKLEVTKLRRCQNQMLFKNSNVYFWRKLGILGKLGSTNRISRSILADFFHWTLYYYYAFPLNNFLKTIVFLCNNFL